MCQVFDGFVMGVIQCLQEISEELDLRIKKYLRGGAANLKVGFSGIEIVLDIDLFVCLFYFIRFIWKCEYPCLHFSGFRR